MNLQKTFNILYLITLIFSIDTAHTASLRRNAAPVSKEEAIIMKKRHILRLLIALALIAAMCAWIVAKHNKDNTNIVVEDQVDPNDLTESDDFELEEREEGNGIAFDEEGDGASVETVKKDVSDFYGEWEATSDQAHYLYGSIDITVKEDGTWEGEITEEPLNGTWEDMGDHLHMNNDIFSFDLAYSNGGNLMMIDTDSDDVIYTVLTKKQ